MITEKMRENAHKITYLVMAYPEKKLAEIVPLMQIPAIQINAGIWAAQELGFISKPDEKTGFCQLLSEPALYEFGEHERELEASLVYCFKQLLDKEQDMEETYLSSWTNGYGSHDVLIAMKRLLDGHVLAEYEIEDGDNTYTFYTNYDTREQQYGRKDFKTDPKPPKKGKK